MGCLDLNLAFRRQHRFVFSWCISLGDLKLGAQLQRNPQYGTQNWKGFSNRVVAFSVVLLTLFNCNSLQLTGRQVLYLQQLAMNLCSVPLTNTSPISGLTKFCSSLFYLVWPFLSVSKCLFIKFNTFRFVSTLLPRVLLPNWILHDKWWHSSNER